MAYTGPGDVSYQQKAAAFFLAQARREEVETLKQDATQQQVESLKRQIESLKQDAKKQHFDPETGMTTYFSGHSKYFQYSPKTASLGSSKRPVVTLDETDPENAPPPPGTSLDDIELENRRRFFRQEMDNKGMDACLCIQRSGDEKGFLFGSQRCQGNARLVIHDHPELKTVDVSQEGGVRQPGDPEASFQTVTSNLQGTGKKIYSRQRFAEHFRFEGKGNATSDVDITARQSTHVETNGPVRKSHQFSPHNTLRAHGPHPVIDVVLNTGFKPDATNRLDAQEAEFVDAVVGGAGLAEVKTGPGPDRLVLANREVTPDMGDGIGFSNSAEGTTFSVNTGDGNDRVDATKMLPALGDGAPAAKGRIDLGNGDDAFLLPQNTSLGGLVVDGGSGNNAVAFAGSRSDNHILKHQNGDYTLMNRADRERRLNEAGHLPANYGTRIRNFSQFAEYGNLSSPVDIRTLQPDEVEGEPPRQPSPVVETSSTVSVPPTPPPAVSPPTTPKPLVPRKPAASPSPSSRVGDTEKSEPPPVRAVPKDAVGGTTPPPPVPPLED